MFKVLLIAIFTIFSFSSFAADKYVCQVDTKKNCGEKVCENTKVLDDDYRIIDTVKKTYTIGKDVFDLEKVSSSGIFTIFKVGGAGYMKMNWMEKDDLMILEKGKFMEVRDLFLTSIISWGTCKF
jgi:hypothetical protein